MEKALKERNARRFLATDIVYFSDPFEKFNPAEHAASHVGITENLSTNGACMFTERRIRRGMKLKLAFGEPDRPPCIATVKWCRKSPGQLYRVGLFWPDLT